MIGFWFAFSYKNCLTTTNTLFLLLSLVLICRRSAWDSAAAYVNIYRRHIICPRHWPPACLRSWAEFNLAGKPAIVGVENNLCEHHLRNMRRYVWRNNSIFPTIPDFQNGGGKCRTWGCRKSANKVWYWPWFVRQYFLRVLIFPNFSFLLT